MNVKPKIKKFQFPRSMFLQPITYIGLQHLLVNNHGRCRRHRRSSIRYLSRYRSIPVADWDLPCYGLRHFISFRYWTDRNQDPAFRHFKIVLCMMLFRHSIEAFRHRHSASGSIPYHRLPMSPTHSFKVDRKCQIFLNIRSRGFLSLSDDSNISLSTHPKWI